MFGKLALAIGAIAAIDGTTAQRFPGETWDRTSPEDQGMDSARLEAAFDYAFPEGSLTTYCAAVFRNGVLVGERYNQLLDVQPDDQHVTWSVSKAIFSTLIGILEKDGILHADDLASDYIEEWRGVPGAEDITIDMLLRHDSGRYFETINDFVIPQGIEEPQTDFAISLPMQSTPGTQDVYNQMAFQSMERIWRVATGGQKVSDMFWDMLPRRLGFENRAFFQERSFILDVPNGDGGLVYGGVHTTCRDLGRFGHLWLNNGTWAGEEIVERQFYDRALERARDRAGRRYHWGGPPNVRANGLGGQFVSFNRENGVVITRLGDMTSLGFSAGTFVDRVMNSLRAEERGTWDLLGDEVNDLDKEEEIMGEYLMKYYNLRQEEEKKE